MSQLLIENTATLQQYFKVANDFPFENIKSSVIMAQNRYLKKVLGKTLWNSYFNSMSTALKEKLNPYLHAAVTNLALYLYLDKGAVMINSGGVYRRESEKEKTAYRYQSENLKFTLLDHGHNLLEDLIEFLQSNVQDYPLWKASSFYLENTKLLLSNATELERVLPKYSGRLVYLALLESIRYVEDFYIQPLLCDYYQELLLKKHQVSHQGINYTLAPEDALLLPDLHRAIAYLAIHQGLPNLSVEINLFGVTQNMKSDREAHLMFEPAPLDNLQLIQKDARYKGMNYLDKVKRILHSNINDYPTYENSPCYVPDSETRKTGNLDQMRPRSRDSFFQT